MSNNLFKMYNRFKLYIIDGNENISTPTSGFCTIEENLKDIINSVHYEKPIYRQPFVDLTNIKLRDRLETEKRCIAYYIKLCSELPSYTNHEHTELLLSGMTYDEYRKHYFGK